ncbi:MAG TPA: CBS domain-containing protein [Ramlibacter sp.]|nr:CBS domain-containing protein [Ramlibacter sp.]
MSRSVESLMQRPVWTVQPDDTLEAIEKEMVARRLTWAPVAEAGGAVIGVVSAHDLMRFRAEHQAPDTKAWQLCSYRPLTVRADASASEAAALMLRAGVHHLVVEGEDGGMRGVLSSLDLLHAVAANG